MVTLYAAKVAAARLTLPRAQQAAAVAAIRAEERAALAALKRNHAAREAAHRAAVQLVTGRVPRQPGRPPTWSRGSPAARHGRE